MRKETTTDVICEGCRTVPVSYLSLDLVTPLGGWPASLEARGIEVVTDDVGRPSIGREALGELVAERAEEARQRAEEQRRRTEEAAQRKVVPRGAPGKDGMSAVEAMMSQDPAFSRPDQDYGRVIGNPTQELMDAQFAEGQRRQAEKRRQNAEKKRIAEAKAKAKKAREAADKALKQ